MAVQGWGENQEHSASILPYFGVSHFSYWQSVTLLMATCGDKLVRLGARLSVAFRHHSMLVNWDPFRLCPFVSRTMVSTFTVLATTRVL